MRLKYTILVLSILILGMVGTPQAVSASHDFQVRHSTRAAVTPDQTNIWYREDVYLEFNPEGNVWTDVNMVGNNIGFDNLDLNQIVTPEIQSIFSYASMWTSPPNNPNERNTQISFTFRTNQPDVAEAAALSIINALGSQILMQSLNFDGSNGYDRNDGSGFVSYTDVWYSAHVDWTNMQQVINNSIPRTVGGLAATIDVTDASNLNFQVWLDGGNSLAGSIGVDFNRFVEALDGGHHYNLTDLIHVSQFSVADYSDNLFINIWMPTVSNLGASIGNTTDTTVYIRHWDPQEPQQDYTTTNLQIIIRNSDSYNEISIDFDYQFSLWAWKNRDSLWWDVDRRGYSSINVQTLGLERAAPSFELLSNQTIFGDALEVNFNLDYPSTIINGQHNFYLDVTFTDGYDFSAANATTNAVALVLEGLGLKFSNYWNFSDNIWGNGDTNRWYNRNQTDITVDGITYAGFIQSRTQFENIITGMYAYGRSAALSQTDLSVIDEVGWNVQDEVISRSSRVSLRVNPDHWAKGNITTGFVQNADAKSTANLLDPYQLGWGGNLPWNNLSESVELHYGSPFIGDWDALTFVPDTNNGFAWDSSRWYDQYYDYQRFWYDVRIYDNNPQIQDYNNGNPINVSSMNEVSVTYDSHFFGNDVDLEAPYINDLWYDNGTQRYGYQLQDYPTYHPMWQNDGVLSGNQDLALEISDWSSQYFNGTQWIDRFPTSGIKNATSYFYRTDAPIDHPIFTQNLEFTHNSSWVYDSPNHQVWDATLNTSMLPDGEWQLWTETFDNDGNKGEQHAGTFVIDNYDDSYQPAVITWDPDSPKENQGVADIVNFNFTIKDDVGMYVVIAWNNLGGWFVDTTSTFTNSSGIYSTYTFKVDVEAQGLPEDYPFTITIEALDMDGHWSYADVSVFVDNQKSGDPPTVELVAPADGMVVNNSLTDNILFTAKIADDLGIESVLLEVTGTKDREFSMFYNNDTGLYEFEASIGSWEVGSYQWNVVVTDVDQNTHIVSATSSNDFSIVGTAVVIIDTIAPVIALTSPNDGDKVSGDVEIIAKVTDNVGVAQVTFIDQDNQENSMTHGSGNSYSVSWDSSTGSDGEKTLKITARDANGNSDVLEFTLVADNGRTASAPAIGLPGFELMVSLAAIFVVIPIIRRRN